MNGVGQEYYNIESNNIEQLTYVNTQMLGFEKLQPILYGDTYNFTLNQNGILATLKSGGSSKPILIKPKQIDNILLISERENRILPEDLRLPEMMKKNKAQFNRNSFYFYQTKNKIIKFDLSEMYYNESQIDDKKGSINDYKKFLNEFFEEEKKFTPI